MREEALELPDDGLPVVERDVVRLVVLDIENRVLLFHTRDSSAPELGTCWELPGGGIEPGVTRAEAAIRELHEEAGLAEDVIAAVGAPTWHRHATYQYRGSRRLQHEVVLPVLVHGHRPVIKGSRRDQDETEDCFEARWWPVSQIANSHKRFYPGRLPELLPAFLLGVQIEEPFEVWS